MFIGNSGSFTCRQSALAVFVVVALGPYAAEAQRPSDSPVGDQEQTPVGGRGAHQESSESPSGVLSNRSLHWHDRRTI